MNTSPLSINVGDDELVVVPLADGKLLIGVSGFPGVILNADNQETLLEFLLERSRQV